ncbi:MAG: hypothetical protein V1917_02270 [Candidatus Gottesmanbacteria bacterium]
MGKTIKGDNKMENGQKNFKNAVAKKQRLIVTWNAPHISGTDTGYQSRQMIGASESGCCRQSGSPCSAKKY